MADKAALVDQIKNIQRSDPDAKQAWWDYCDSTLGGVKDPNRHEADVLQEFMALQSSGQLAQFAKPHHGGGGGGGGGRTRGGGGGAGGGGGRGGYGVAAYYPPAAPWNYAGGGGSFAGGGGGWGHGGGGGGGPGSASLADFVKTGQRMSPAWKASWQSYCALYGAGYFDPARYDDTFITGFIDYAGELALRDLGAQAAESGMNLEAAIQQQKGGGKGDRGTKRMAADGGGQPSAKRASTGGWGAADSGDAEKVALVSKVKDLQRSSAEVKQAWWTFCDETLGGIKDPNRHTADTLQEFLTTFG